MSAPAAPAQIAQAPLETPLPSAQTLLHAAKMAIQADKPIQMDYYVDTCTKKAFIGEDETTKDKVLIKSKEEFTSLINNIFKAGEDYLVVTENSIYIVSNKVGRKKIPVSALLAQE